MGPTLKPALKPIKIRKKPIEVEAIKWSFDTCTRQDLLDFGIRDEDIALGRSGPSGEMSLWIYNTLEKCWVNVPDGHWIIKGIGGEFYPHCPKLFPQVYDIIPEETAATSTEPKKEEVKFGLSEEWINSTLRKIDEYIGCHKAECPMSRDSIRTAKQFVKDIAPCVSKEPTVSHTPDGHVTFRWFLVGVYYFTIVEVTCKGTSLFFKGELNHGDGKYGRLNLNLDTLASKEAFDIAIVYINANPNPFYKEHKAK
jgi:hypothetical protein